MEKGTAHPVPFCLKKNRTVPFNGKFSPVFPYKWKSARQKMNTCEGIPFFPTNDQWKKIVAFDFTPEQPGFRTNGRRPMLQCDKGGKEYSVHW